MKSIFALVLMVLVAGSAFAAHLTDLVAKAGLQSIADGTKLVDFTLDDLSGNKVTLSKLSGKVVLLNFWATWCGPCRSEIPSLETLYQKYKASGLVVLAVNLQESGSNVQAFVKKFKMTFPVVLDSTGKVGAEYGARAIPTTYVIDKQGNVTSGIMGAKEWVTPEMDSLLTRLLKQ